MNLIAHVAKNSIVAIAAIVFISCAASYGQNPPSNPNDKSAERRLNMLVLGDSIMWGEGLKDEHKAWYQVKVWLNRTAGREVREKIEAHSGAVVGSVGDPPANSVTPFDGEVNSAVPSVNDELDMAVKSYADPSQVDLVLVDGCVNDVGVFNLLNGGNSTEEIDKLASSRCGPPMRALLKRVADAFPSAHIIVTGYFPIISEKTPDSLLMRAVAKLFYRSSPGASKVNSNQLRERLVANSRFWYQASNAALADAVRHTNDEIATGRPRQRVLFVQIPFPPEYSFAAKETRLWSFNASFLRKLLAIITLGKISLRTNDEQRRQRIASCDDFYKRPANEDKQQKQTRELRRMLCYYASIGHPNRKGALIYSQAIIDQVKSAIGDAGWLRDLGPVTVPNSPVR
ncbi:MAG TPA: SGNH/GDSL hydrolase family protein [Pyrinomonadaceae bacterium]|nr:SGNH/GDSL hydrolase family protein [Pyrinomonadaceae bacterium]